jgi:O-antigen/teichoic acid export membrane protein
VRKREQRRRGVAPPQAVVEPGEEGWPGTGADAAASTTAGSLLRGGAWNTTSRIVPQLYVLAISIAGARFLGAEQFGRQSFIAFVQLSLILFLSGGLSITATRFVGDLLGRQQPAAVASLVRWVWRVEAIAALAGGIVLVAVAAAGADPESAWVLAAVACTLGILHAAPSALLTGAQRWRAASVVGLVTGAGSTVAIILVLAAGGGITGMFAVEAAVAAVNLIWTSVLARRAVSEVVPAARVERLTGAAWRTLRREVWRYAIPTSYGVLLTIVVWRRSEFFFLDHYSTDTQIALYSVVFAVVAALIQVPDAIAAITLPAVATLSGAGQAEQIRTGFSRALRLVLLATLPVTAVSFALGPTLLRVVYGPEFRDTESVLLIMLAPFPLLPLLSLSRSVLAGLGRLRIPLSIETAAAALNIVLAYLLVSGHGAVGAAVANVAAQTMGAVLVLGYSLIAVGAPQWRPLTLWRAAVAAVAAGFAGWAGVSFLPDAAGLVVGSIAAAVIFAGLAVSLRILPREDAVWLDQHAGERLGGLVGAFCRSCS